MSGVQMRYWRTWSCCKSTHGIKYAACMGNKTCSNCCWNLIHSNTESVCLVLLHPVVERVVLSSYKLLFSYFACLLLLMLLLAYSLGLTTAVHSLLALPLNKYPDCRIYRAVQCRIYRAVQNIEYTEQCRIYRAVLPDRSSGNQNKNM